VLLKDLGEFLKEANGDKAARVERGDQQLWVYALPNANYTFHFSVRTENGTVKKIQARNMEWVTDHVRLFEYVEPPSVVRNAVDERVELVEDPNALAILNEECVKCQKEHLADVTPKIDLLIDGYYAQRVIEEYCPDCGQPLTQRQTFQPPRQYEAAFHNENAPPEHQFEPEAVDISEYTWEHARR
jgi:hypothetical protein